MKMTIKLSLSALLSGMIFGFGLVLSGMTDTHKVIGFLNLFEGWGRYWDFDLAFVMAGAIGLSAIAYQIRRKMAKPVVATAFSPKKSQIIDKNLLVGSALFGLGWGLYGFCPGPAFIGLLYGQSAIFLFVIAMIAGFGLSKYVFRKKGG